MYAAARPVGLDVALTIIARERERSPGVERASLGCGRSLTSRGPGRDGPATAGSFAPREEPDVAQLIDDLASKRDQLAKLVVRGPVSREQYRIEIAGARGSARRRGACAGRAKCRVSARAIPATNRPRRGEGSAPAAECARRVRAVSAAADAHARPPARNALADGLVSRLCHARRRSRRTGPRLDWRGSRDRPARSRHGASRSKPSRLRVGDRRSAPRPLRAGLGRGCARASGIRWCRTLAAATRVFIVPDGPLHLVNWDALPASGTGYLIEHAPLFHYVSAERDLVTGAPRARGQGLLVVDGPVFDDRPGCRLEPGATATRLNDGVAPAERGEVSGLKVGLRGFSIDALRSAACLCPRGGDHHGHLAKRSAVRRRTDGCVSPEWPRRNGSGGQAARGGRTGSASRDPRVLS